LMRIAKIRCHTNPEAGSGSRGCSCCPQFLTGSRQKGMPRLL
jgi:hypothetical protein